MCGLLCILSHKYGPCNHRIKGLIPSIFQVSKGPQPLYVKYFEQLPGKTSEWIIEDDEYIHNPEEVFKVLSIPKMVKIGRGKRVYMYGYIFSELEWATDMLNPKIKTLTLIVSYHQFMNASAQVGFFNHVKTFFVWLFGQLFSEVKPVTQKAVLDFSQQAVVFTLCMTLSNPKDIECPAFQQQNKHIGQTMTCIIICFK